MSEALKFWLVQALDRRGWSHRELARQSGISQTQISAVIAGERKANADFCIKAALALDESPDYALRLAGILPPAAPAESSDDSILQELVELARNLPPEDRQQILDYVRFIYQKRKD